MLRLKNLANKYQKRTCRPLYANTQATPYAATLADTFRAADGSLQLPKDNDTTPIGTRTDDAFTYKGSLVPGLVMVRVGGTEQVTVATGDDTEKPFGLLANFVGGDLDEGFSGDSLQNSVGVWRGPDAVFEVLAPAFDDSDLSGNATNSTGAEILLYSNAKGQLTTDNGTDRPAVARLIERASSTRIIVDLIV